MRTAALAILEYLIGFIALAFFAYLAFGRGQTTDDSFVFAFKASSLLAIGELVFLLARTAPANRLILGANLWLIAGGAAAFTEQWWWLRVYQQFGEASLFLAIFLVGVVSTLFLPSGFIGKIGRCSVLRCSFWSPSLAHWRSLSTSEAMLSMPPSYPSSRCRGSIAC